MLQRNAKFKKDVGFITRKNDKIIMTKFTEEKLELAIIDLLKQEGFNHFVGNDIARISNSDALIKDDLISFLKKYHAK